MDLRIAQGIWRKLAESEARLHLMVELGYIEVGFPDVENFCLNLESKYRSEVEGGLRDKGKQCPEFRVVKLCMELKMIDERKVNKALVSERYKFRKKVEDEFGKNSRRARNMVKKLRQYAARYKKMTMTNHEGKLKHLRKKYRKNEEEKIDQIPEAIADLELENLSIFDRKKYEDKVVEQYEPEILGDIVLHDNERMILMLPPKFPIEENLPKDGLAIENEMAFAKARNNHQQRD